MIVEETISDLPTTFDNARALLYGKYIISMMQRAQLIHTVMPSIISNSKSEVQLLTSASIPTPIGTQHDHSWQTNTYHLVYKGES